MYDQVANNHRNDFFWLLIIQNIAALEQSFKLCCERELYIVFVPENYQRLIIV